MQLPAGPGGMSRLGADGLLLTTALLWGVTFVAQKYAAATMPALAFVAARFAVSAVALAPFALWEFRRKPHAPGRDEWRLALAIGLTLFLGTSLQQAGIETTSATNAGFLTACYVVLTPAVVWALSGARPRAIVLAAASVSLIGAWLLASGAALAAPNIGDALVLAADFAWATGIALTPVFLARSGRPLLLAFVQYAVCAGLAAFCSLMFETVPAGAPHRHCVDDPLLGRRFGRARLHDPDFRSGAYAPRGGCADPLARKRLRRARRRGDARRTPDGRRGAGLPPHPRRRGPGRDRAIDGAKDRKSLMKVEKLSPAEARRIALAAQGFGGPRPEKVTSARWLRTIDRLSLHQIDSVNVLVRAHYLPAFSRLGPYDRSLIDTAAWGGRKQRRLFEYWAHEASLLPLALHPLMRWRMARADRGEAGWKGLRVFARERRAEAEALLQRIRAEGPSAASDLEEKRGRSGWWEWSDAKQALEWLFWAGHITTATRRGSFERVYDLTERVIPAEIRALPTPKETEAQRALIERAASALGVATEAELRDYFRLSPDDARSAIEVPGRGGRARASRGSRLGSARLSAPRRPPAAPHLCAVSSGALRSARLGAFAHAAAVRLPLQN